MQAIITKFFGPGNVRGARVKASADGGSITVPYAYHASSDWNHAAAAEALARKSGWEGTLIGGHTREGMAFVFDRGIQRKIQRKV